MSRNDRCNVFYVNRRLLVSPLASVVPYVKLASFVYSYFDVGIVFAYFFVASQIKNTHIYIYIHIPL